uniref:Uncharacterized protein n=1 Tax=Oryza glumipatula TaxID=40148 RepID=A0A0E0ANM0_9ORYZ
MRPVALLISMQFPISKLASLSRISNPCTGRKSWSVDGSSSGIDQNLVIRFQHLAIRIATTRRLPASSAVTFAANNLTSASPSLVQPNILNNEATVFVELVSFGIILVLKCSFFRKLCSI